MEVPEKWRNAAVIRATGDSSNGTNCTTSPPIQGKRGTSSPITPPSRTSCERSTRRGGVAGTGFDDPFDDDAVRIDLGREPITLTAHDWHEPEGGQVPWNQNVIGRDPAVTGWWAVES